MAKKTNISTIVVTILMIISFVSPVYAKNTTSMSKSSKTANVTTNSSQKKSNTSKNINESSNKTSDSKSSTNVTNSNTNSNSNETKNENASSNANLIALGIKPNDFSGFKESKTEYETIVPYTINEVEVYATPKNRNNTVTGTGKIKLEEGLNTAKIVVTTEKGESKTYTINIKRLKQRRKRKR